jgi:maltose/moltooligosaccharide transporter
MYKFLFGEEVIFTMVLAGTSLIFAGFCTLLITERSASHDG